MFSVQLYVNALIPDDDWWNFHLRCEDFLESCWQKFGLQEYFELKEAKQLIYRIVKGSPPLGDNRPEEEVSRVYQQKIKQIRKQKQKKKAARLVG
jgi:hypothetical protein